MRQDGSRESRDRTTRTRPAETIQLTPTNHTQARHNAKGMDEQWRQALFKTKKDRKKRWLESHSNASPRSADHLIILCAMCGRKHFCWQTGGA